MKCKCGTYRRYGDEIAGRVVAQAMHLDACVNCGYVPASQVETRTTTVAPPETKRRLGDMVGDTLEALGGKTVASAIERVTGADCGCNKRRQFLNNLDEKIRG